nr:AAA family ATPase [Chloroflexota bacterium]
MPRIDRIRIHNFRGASAPFTLGFAKQKPLVVIFGENGTGKTTIVDALDAVGNGSGGSLTTKSSTTLRTHLPTLGKKPSDMVMEVELPRYGGHSIIGHSMLMRRCSRVTHPPSLPSGVQGRSCGP